MVQFDRGTERSSAEAQGIALGSAPRAPFNDDDKSQPEQLLTKPPLERFDLGSAVLIMKIDGEGIHPFVRSQTNRTKPVLEPLR